MNRDFYWSKGGLNSILMSIVLEWDVQDFLNFFTLVLIVYAYR